METDAAVPGRQGVADVVAERIERLIMDGVLKAGQALPSERRLTEKLGASRTALREGLKLLRARGIIRTEQGKGSFVAPISQVENTSSASTRWMVRRISMRSEEHTSELQSLMRISYAVFCLKKTTKVSKCNHRTHKH